MKKNKSGLPITTTILHFAHDGFNPYWRYDNRKDPIHIPPSFDAGTVRSRMHNIEKIPVAKTNKPYNTFPSVSKNIYVKVYNLVNELIYYSRTADFSWDKLAKVKWSCETTDQIMICIHGHEDDTDYGYITKDKVFKEYKKTYKIHYRCLAYFVSKLIQNRQKPVCILLSMCYGGRSEDYQKSHELLSELSHSDLKSSFAYKFAQTLVIRNPHIYLRLTARTGALKFQYETGASLVESEDDISISLACKEKRNKIQELLCNDQKAEVQIDSLRKELRVLAKQSKTLGDGTRAKYGKLIYEFKSDPKEQKVKINISSKYPSCVQLLSEDSLFNK